MKYWNEGGIGTGVESVGTIGAPRTVPGLESSMHPMHPVCFKTSDGQRYLIDWRDIEIAMERDPEGRTVPSRNPNELLLTADDCALLWGMGIGFKAG